MKKLLVTLVSCSFSEVGQKRPNNMSVAVQPESNEKSTLGSSNFDMNRRHGNKISLNVSVFAMKPKFKGSKLYCS